MHRLVCFCLSGSLISNNHLTGPRSGEHLQAAISPEAAGPPWSGQRGSHRRRQPMRLQHHRQPSSAAAAQPPGWTSRRCWITPARPCSPASSCRPTASASSSPSAQSRSVRTSGSGSSVYTKAQHLWPHVLRLKDGRHAVLQVTPEWTPAPTPAAARPRRWSQPAQRRHSCRMPRCRAAKQRVVLPASRHTAAHQQNGARRCTAAMCAVLP